MKKKFLSVLLSATMLTGLLAGCGSSDNTQTDTAADNTQTVQHRQITHRQTQLRTMQHRLTTALMRQAKQLL